jgi:hypothetical protein
MGTVIKGLVRACEEARSKLNLEATLDLVFSEGIWSQRSAR